MMLPTDTNLLRHAQPPRTSLPEISAPDIPRAAIQVLFRRLKSNLAANFRIRKRA